MHGFYFCLSVLTTVGYGDVHAYTDFELLFSIAWMLFGVAFYSFMIGIISSFFQIRETKASLVTKRKKKLEQIPGEDLCGNSPSPRGKFVEHMWLESWRESLYLEFA